MTANKTDMLNDLLVHFQIDRKTYRFQEINQGYINDTYLVLDPNNAPLYILQRVNQNVFKDIKGIMQNINNVFDLLVDPEYTSITIFKTHNGLSYYNQENAGYWRLMTYINNSTAYNNAPDEKIAFGAGKVVGKFHQLLADAVLDRYVDTIPRFHDLSLREKQFEDSLISAKKEKLEISRSAILFAKDTLEKLRVIKNDQLPLRVCHNDTKLNNILFSKDENKALCLIDLDTVMKGYFYFDFGDAIRTIANRAEEDEQDHSKITFEKPLFEAFIDGLESNGAFLHEEELDTL